MKKANQILVDFSFVLLRCKSTIKPYVLIMNGCD